MPSADYSTEIFSFADSSILKNKSISWASRFSHFSFFTGCGIAYPHEAFSDILFAGIQLELTPPVTDSFVAINNFFEENRYWITGYFTYDLKNEIEDLTSLNFDGLVFDKFHFFQPEYVVEFTEGGVSIGSSKNDHLQIFQAIVDTEIIPNKLPHIPTTLIPRISRVDYLKTVKKIINHILEGDIYELNYCMEFFNEQVEIDPYSTFRNLIDYSPAPFSVLLKIGHHIAICNSPERFLKKEAHMLISQPMKGTARRGNDPSEDELNKNTLQKSEKERAENLMITDLVRNDLAKSAKPGTVQVQELCGVYSFAHVHQMISTVVAQMKPGINHVEIIQNAFPMGSMTGAPKVKAMELIEKYEKTKRGLFSGSIGYMNSAGDFDFNVVIRSLLYNMNTGYLSLQVGSAITYDSDPAQEYDECLLKAQAIMKILGDE